MMSESQYVRYLASNSTCCAIAALEAGLEVNIIGAVVSFQEPKKSRGEDFMMNLVLADVSTGSTGDRLLAVNLFRRRREELPYPIKPGQLLFLASARIQRFNGKLQAVSAKTSRATLVFESGIMPQELRKYMGDCVVDVLRQWIATQDLSMVKRVAVDSGGRKRPVLCASALQPGQYFDFYAQVIHVLPFTKNSSQITVVLSDYSSNNYLRKPSSDILSSIPIPPEMLVLCTLWDEHCVPGRTLQPGQLVLLKNLVVKNYSEGLEVSLHGDRYGSAAGSKKVFVIAAGETERVPEIRDLFARRQIVMDSVARANILTETTHTNKPIQTIGQIRKSSIPNKHKLSGKVVDFLPISINDWSRPYCKACGHFMPPNAQPNSNNLLICSNCHTSMDTTQYRLLFSLLLEDSNGERLPVIFAGEEASRFLQMPMNCNLGESVHERTRIEQCIRNLQEKEIQVNVTSYFRKDDKIGGQIVASNDRKRRYKAFGSVLINK